METKDFIEEQNLLANFEVEELEKRYEMGWISGASVSGHYGGPDDWDINVGMTLNFN